MNTEILIYEIIAQEIGNGVEIADIAEGINAYVKNEQLEAFAERFPEDMRVAALKMYMKPILDHGSRYTLNYFKNYISHLEFDKLSKAAFELAKAKKNGEAVSRDDVDEIEAAFNEIYTHLSTNYRSGTSFFIKVSETLLDIKFAKGESRQMSFRLMHSGV